MIDPASLRLYLVADPSHVRGELIPAVHQALEGGVSMVQLRAKALSDREHLTLAVGLQDLCSRYRVPFLVNDRMDIALAAHAAGVHLGVDDLPTTSARDLGGPDFIIGFSPENDEQILAARATGADYLGIGPVFGTITKSDAGSALGITEFGRRCSISPVPVVGIGGIGTGNAAAVVEAGAAGIAIVSAILGAVDVGSAARALRDQVTTTVR